MAASDKKETALAAQEKGAAAKPENIVDTLFSLLDNNGEVLTLDAEGQIPDITIGTGDLIPLKEWALRNGISPASARQKAGRGGFLTARKVGRDWMISAREPRIDNRAKLPQKDRLALSGPVYISKVLNYLIRLGGETLPETWQENTAHRDYCKRIFFQLRGRLEGNTLRLFDLLCDAMAVQTDSDVCFIPHDEIMASLEDEAWRTTSGGSAARSAITIDFKDYLLVLKNTARDLLSHSIELKVHHDQQTLFLPWYHSLSWEETSGSGAFFVPSNFFKMIFSELNNQV